MTSDLLAKYNTAVPVSKTTLLQSWLLFKAGPAALLNDHTSAHHQEIYPKHFPFLYVCMSFPLLRLPGLTVPAAAVGTQAELRQGCDLLSTTI